MVLTLLFDVIWTWVHMLIQSKSVVSLFQSADTPRNMMFRFRKVQILPGRRRFVSFFIDTKSSEFNEHAMIYLVIPLDIKTLFKPFLLTPGTVCYFFDSRNPLKVLSFLYFIILSYET